MFKKTNVQATPVMPKPAETTYQAPTSSQTNTSVGFQGSVQKPKTPNNIAAPDTKYYYSTKISYYG